MVQRVFSPADVQGVAVGQKWLAAQLLDQVDNYLRIVWTQESKVPRLAKMDLDGSVFVLKINVGDARLTHKMIQLFQKIRSGIYLH